MNTQFDIKHLIALVLGFALSLGMAWLSKQGIQVSCPQAPAAAAVVAPASK